MRLILLVKVEEIEMVLVYLHNIITNDTGRAVSSCYLINKNDYIFIVIISYKYMTDTIFDFMRYNNSNECYKNAYNYYIGYIYKDRLLTENAIIFLEKYDKYLEHRFEYIIDLLDSGSAVCNDAKTYLEVSTKYLNFLNFFKIF